MSMLPSVIYFDRPLPVGMRMGQLTVIGWEFNKKFPESKVIFHILRCDCGKVVRVPVCQLQTYGLPHDCALSTTLDGWRFVPYGEITDKGLVTHGDSGTRLYGRWLNMRRRCSDPKCRAYHRYGGRGIRVCAEWEHDYHAFKVWSVHHGYREDLEIDRIDNDGNYEPSNCRYVTKQENLKNKGHHYNTKEHSNAHNN